jgi:predicted molibdopterin-dependent oxidoreductase YjgC
MSKQKNITAIIDGEPVQVPGGHTVLDAARKAGIYIPTLCYLENLEPYGGCRLCIVDIKGWKGFPTACTTPLEPGMEIRTKTPGLQRLRAEILEFTLSEHPYTCLVCKDKRECTDFMHTTRKSGTITGCNFCTSNGDCELQDLIDYLDLRDVRFPISYRGIPPEKKNPFYDLDYNLCILCGRCVRICNEERNSHVLAFVQRGNSSIVGTAFGESQINAGCEFCGACVDVCPTGSISEKMGKWAGVPNRSTETTCVLCSVGCTMNVNTRDGRVVNIGPRPGHRTDPRQLCIRGKFLPGDFSQHPSRVTTPRIRRNGKWVEVNWEEALQFTAGRLEKYRAGQFGMICSAQDTLEENYILQKFTRKVMHSNHVDLYASYPGRDLPNEIHASYLSTSTAGTMDVTRADTCLVLGTDASIAHPLLENRIRKAFSMGRNILYAGPRPTRTSTFANLEIHYAADEEYHFLYALMAGLAMVNKSVLPAGIVEHFKKADLAIALERCAVTEKDLDPFIETLARSRNLCIVAADDYLRSDTGKDMLRALGNFPLLIGKQSRCKIMIPSYEGNMLAGTLVGVHPDILPGYDSVADVSAIRKWNKNWHARLSVARGFTFNEMLQGIGKDGISALMIAGDIPPQPKLKKIPFLVQLNMFHTGISEHADVFLPVTGFLESEGHIMTLDGKIKRIRRVLPGPGITRSIPSIVSAIAGLMNETGFPGTTTGSIWKEIASHNILSAVESGRENQKFQPIKPRYTTGKHGTASPRNEGYDHFRYRGNELTALIPDLQMVVEGLNAHKTSYGQGT